MQYQNMSIEQKKKIHNRVQQWALKARDSLPNDHGVFCLVLLHLMKNSHRYFNLEVPSDLQRHILQNQPLKDSKNLTLCDMSKEVNKKLRVACDLKGKNRLVKHQNVVQQLKKEFKSFRNLSSVSGIALKTVHNWCSLPKQKVHKAKELSQLRRTEFEQFLLQDTISFAHPSKRYAGKRFLCDTLDMTRKKYLAQPEYHKYGIVSMSTMKMYRPRYIFAVWGRHHWISVYVTSVKTLNKFSKHY